MGLIVNFFVNWMLDRPSRKYSAEKQTSLLEETDGDISSRAGQLSDSDNNRKYLSHIIGIERWAQSRLKVAFGEPFIEEEYNRYRPSREVGWQELQEQFKSTRADSITLAQQIGRDDALRETKVKHNDFGEIPLRVWLHYMYFHANFESKRLK